MMRLLLLVTTILVLCSCDNKIEFNSKKWQSFEAFISDREESLRERMLDDLIQNVLRFNGLEPTSLVQVEGLLGQPNGKQLYSDTTSKLLGEYCVYTYEVSEKYGYDIDPSGGVNLELVFDIDSTLVSWKVISYSYRN